MTFMKKKKLNKTLADLHYLEIELAKIHGPGPEKSRHRKVGHSTGPLTPVTSSSTPATSYFQVAFIFSFN